MNRNYLILLFGIIVLAVLAFFYFRKEKEVKNYPSGGTDIIAFGDSLVAGYGATSPDKNFVSRLSAKINQPIINLGINGNTTADGVSRLNEFDQYKPKVVLILLGGNDFLRQVPSETTFKNLSTIIESLQNRGAIVVLLGIRGGIFSDKFDEEFEKLAEKHQTAYVPNVLNGLLGDGRYMFDSIHPNDAGYEKIANKIYPVLSRLLK